MQTSRHTAALFASIALCLASAHRAWAAPVPLQNGTATGSQTGLTADQAVDGPLVGVKGWAISIAPEEGTDFTADQTLVAETVSDVGDGGMQGLTFKLFHQFGGNETLGKFRISY